MLPTSYSLTTDMIYKYKQILVLNNPQGLIFYKTLPNQSFFHEKSKDTKDFLLRSQKY